MSQQVAKLSGNATKTLDIAYNNDYNAGNNHITGGSSYGKKS